MPIGPCVEGNKPGYRWGGQGKCYVYTPGDKAGQAKAKAEAGKQGQAAHANGFVEKMAEGFAEAVRLAKDAGFEEKHPRGEGGKFGEGGSEGEKVGWNSQHHVAFYNGKVVAMDYIAEAKNEFKRAAQRISDNNAEGHVITPDGKVFRVSQSNRSAKAVKGDDAEKVLQDAASLMTKKP